MLPNAMGSEGVSIFQDKKRCEGSMLLALRGHGWVSGFQEKALRNISMNQYSLATWNSAEMKNIMVYGVIISDRTTSPVVSSSRQA